MDLRGTLLLLAVDDDAGAVAPEEDVAQARRELDEALAALRAARADWSSAHAPRSEPLREALDVAQRRLDAARARLQRALRRRR